MANIFIFCLAAMAGLLGIRVHGVTVMSTHIHLVVTDVRGVLPKFTHRFHRLVALATQRHRGWRESVFNRSQTSVVELCTPEAIIDKLAYLIVNPVKAGAVRYAQDWPGLITYARDIGVRTLTATRPTVYFRAKKWAAWASIAIVWPEQVLEVMSADAARAAVERRVEELSAEARRDIERSGRSFLGAKRCVSVSVEKRATTHEAWGTLNPTFATGGNAEAHRRASSARQAFREDYSDALERWRAGDRQVEFPIGTWLMRVLHDARVAQPPLRAAA